MGGRAARAGRRVQGERQPLGCDPPWCFRQSIKRRKVDVNAACLEGFCNLDAPDCRNTAASLTPFQTRGSFGAQLGGGCVHDLPSECVVWHDGIIGRFVQTVKDQLPNDSQRRAWHNLSMPDKPASSDYNAELIARVKSLREGMRMPDGARWTSEQMAKALDIPADRYRKYELRTPLPHELIERFALIVGVTVEFLVTGNKPASIATARYRKRAADSSKREERRA